MPHVRVRAHGSMEDAWVSVCGLRRRADLPRTLLYSSSQSILKISVGFPQPMNCETTRKTINKNTRSTMHIINLSVASLRPMSRTYTHTRTRTQTETLATGTVTRKQQANREQLQVLDLSLFLSLSLSLKKQPSTHVTQPRC